MKDSTCACLCALIPLRTGMRPGVICTKALRSLGVLLNAKRTPMGGRDSAAQAPGESSCGIRVWATASAPSHLGAGVQHLCVHTFVYKSTCLRPSTTHWPPPVWGVGARRSAEMMFHPASHTGLRKAILLHLANCKLLDKEKGR